MSGEADRTVKDTSCNNDELPPAYDMIRKEHMEEVHYDEVPKESSENPSPQYETVASVRAGSPTTESGPPPSLPPRIPLDPDAPPLPAPFDPESSAEEVGHSEERVGESSRTEESGENDRERHIAREVRMGGV